MTRNENKVVKAQIKEAIRLGDLPANKLTPTDLAREATASQPKKVKTKVLGEKEMEKLGMNLLLGVSRGSDEEAKLIILEFMNGKKGDKPTVLIGKGLTFDMGGNSIKPASNLHLDEARYVGWWFSSCSFQCSCGTRPKDQLSSYHPFVREPHQRSCN